MAEIARHRLAYAEYQSALEGIEKSIEAAWAKRIKKYGVKKPVVAPGSTGRPPLPENVKRLVQVRKGWLDSVGLCMRERPRGEVLGLPATTVYEGIGDDEEKDERSVEDVIDLDMEVDDE